MIGSGPQNGFRVTKKNIDKIRLISQNVSQLLGTENASRMDMGRFLDTLSLDWGINYVTLDEHEMPSGIEAYCIPEDFSICLRSDVYARACTNHHPRDRFTVFHELGHLLLGHRRTINREKDDSSPLKTIEDSEWQANQFAGEILMPYTEIKLHNLQNEFDIQNHFDVSFQAASTRFSQLQRRGEM